MVEAKYILKKYLWVIVLGALMAVGLAVFFMREHTPLISSIVFTENVRGMELDLWHDTVDDVYYLFLPSYVSRKNVAWSFPDGVYVKSTPPHIGNGTTLDGLPIGEPIELAISTRGHSTEKYTIEILQSENLRTFFIETREGAMESLHKSKTNKTQASLVVIDTSGKENWSGITTLSGRGHTTFLQPKLPCKLKFNGPTNLGSGIDSVTNWLLLANYADDSQMRNAVSYYIAREVGISYTSDTEFVSLYINGEYQGLYNLANREGYLTDVGEKVRAVFERSQWKGRPYDGVTSHEFYFITRFGNTDEILNAMNRFEDALFGDSSYAQLKKYADMEALARKYFVDAECGNYDLRLSQYYMLNSEGKIVPICAWDYDHSFGLGFKYLDFAYNQIPLSFPWYNKLITYKEFRAQLLKIMQQYSYILTSTCPTYVDSLSLELAEDWNLNNVRWRHYDTFHEYQKPPKCDECDYGSIYGYGTNIVNYMEQRYHFLEAYWKDPSAFCELTFYDERDSIFQTHIALYYPHGDILTKDKLPDGMLEMPDEGFAGWYTIEGQSVEDVGIITNDMVFEERRSPIEEISIFEKKVKKLGLLVAIMFLVSLLAWIAVKRWWLAQ